VRVEGLPGQLQADNRPVIGRVAETRSVPAVFGAGGVNRDRLEICTSLALAQVNACLKQQGRSELKVTERALLQQLREDGRLLDLNGEPLAPDADPTRRVRLGGQQVWTFAVSRRQLLGDG
jgi:hypothetical protein